MRIATPLILIGAVESVSELAELRRDTIPPATLDVPAGFRQEAAPGAR